jgi:hypothetical protein
MNLPKAQDELNTNFHWIATKADAEPLYATYKAAQLAL